MMAMAFRGFGSGDYSAIDPTASSFMPVQSPDVAKPKFGAWQAIGAIGDALQAAGGSRGTYLPMVAAQQQRQQELTDAAAQRNAAVQDWIFKQQYEAANPGPSSIERDVAAFQKFTPEQRSAYGQLQDLKAGPVTVSLPNGFVYSGNRAGLGEALGGTAQPSMPPAPTLGDNGLPQFLTPEQLLATEQALGKEKTAAWRSRNRIPLAKTINGTTYYEIDGKVYDNPEGR